MLNKMNCFFYLSIVVIILGCRHNNDHSEHQGHDHQSLHIQMERELNQASFSMEGHGEILPGFEKEPSTNEEKNKLKKKFEVLDQKINSVIRTFPDNKCLYIRKNLSFLKQEHHFMFQILYHCTCDKPVIGSLKFDFSQVFPNLSTVSVNWLSGTTVKEKTVSARGGMIELK